MVGNCKKFHISVSTQSTIESTDCYSWVNILSKKFYSIGFECGWESWIERVIKILRKRETCKKFFKPVGLPRLLAISIFSFHRTLNKGLNFGTGTFCLMDILSTDTFLTGHIFDGTYFRQDIFLTKHIFERTNNFQLLNK